MKKKYNSRLVFVPRRILWSYHPVLFVSVPKNNQHLMNEDW